MAKELIELFSTMKDVCSFIEQVEKTVVELSNEMTLGMMDSATNGIDVTMQALQIQDIITQQLSLSTHMSQFLQEKIASISIKELHNTNEELKNELSHVYQRQQDFLGNFRNAGSSDEIDDSLFFD